MSLAQGREGGELVNSCPRPRGGCDVVWKFRIYIAQLKHVHGRLLAGLGRRSIERQQQFLIQPVSPYRAI